MTSNMKKIIFSFLIVLLFSVKASAQESNLKVDYTSYLPEIREMNKVLGNLPPAPSLLTKEGLEQARSSVKSDLYVASNTILKPFVKKVEAKAGNSISLTIFKPDTVRAVVLSIHGGGWYSGSPSIDSKFNDELARNCNVAVVSVDYRLAPENPFPAGLEDCKAAMHWLLQNSKEEFNTDKIIISGGSAGGHLAALTTLYTRDSLHSIDRVIGVNLIYGIYDLGLTPSHRLATDNSFLPKKKLSEMMQLVFCDLKKDLIQQPEFSPLYANLKDLPPAFFTVGDADPFADDTYFMESRWRMAGNRTFLAVYPECPHGIDGMPLKISDVVRTNMYRWINSLL